MALARGHLRKDEHGMDEGKNCPDHPTLDPFAGALPEESRSCAEAARSVGMGRRLIRRLCSVAPAFLGGHWRPSGRCQDASRELNGQEGRPAAYPLPIFFIREWDVHCLRSGAIGCPFFSG